MKKIKTLPLACKQSDGQLEGSLAETVPLSVRTNAANAATGKSSPHRNGNIAAESHDVSSSGEVRKLGSVHFEERENPVSSTASEGEDNEVARANIVSQILASVRGEASSDGNYAGGKQIFQSPRLPVAASSPRTRLTSDTSSSNNRTPVAGNVIGNAAKTQSSEVSGNDNSTPKPCVPPKSITTNSLTAGKRTEKRPIRHNETDSSPSATTRCSQNLPSTDNANSIKTSKPNSSQDKSVRFEADANRVISPMEGSLRADKTVPSATSGLSDSKECRSDQAVTQFPRETGAPSLSASGEIHNRRKQLSYSMETDASGKERGDSFTRPAEHREMGTINIVIESVRESATLESSGAITEPVEQNISRDSMSYGSWSGMTDGIRTTEIPQSLSADSGISSPTDNSCVVLHARESSEQQVKQNPDVFIQIQDQENGEYREETELMDSLNTSNGKAQKETTTNIENQVTSSPNTSINPTPFVTVDAKLKDIPNSENVSNGNISHHSPVSSDISEEYDDDDDKRNIGGENASYFHSKTLVLPSRYGYSATTPVPYGQSLTVPAVGQSDLFPSGIVSDSTPSLSSASSSLLSQGDQNDSVSAPEGECRDIPDCRGESDVTPASRDVNEGVGASPDTSAPTSQNGDCSQPLVSKVSVADAEQRQGPINVVRKLYNDKQSYFTALHIFSKKNTISKSATKHFPVR
ncbi:hypothetical protein PoB_006045300 [Plakobranchus ocellatus]|uniref:Uncharacterized protein n=1 Tax=Plakobranchus ocellatus TaxID=259542 RepID=A0AAV4CPZ3_9GAST|nr:hypothetical protein PoB_006045300 [Plakobranchus ocellatus]